MCGVYTKETHKRDMLFLAVFCGKIPNPKHKNPKNQNETQEFSLSLLTQSSIVLSFARTLFTIANPLIFNSFSYVYHCFLRLTDNRN